MILFTILSVLIAIAFIILGGYMIYFLVVSAIPLLLAIASIVIIVGGIIFIVWAVYDFIILHF